MPKLPKIVLVGDSNTGKSSLLNRFVNDEFIAMESTIGAAFIEHAKFEMWDTAGQERYRSLAPMYYRGAAAAIVVYDMTNEKSFEGAKTWVKELRSRVGESIVIALVGNKLDLADDDKFDKAKAEIYAAEEGLVYSETSAKSGHNVNKLFDDLELMLQKKNTGAEKASPEGGKKLTNVYPKTGDSYSKSWKCCQ